ncbi:MAG: hypothetical protein ACPF8U_05575 [Flavobacteriales bacterium]
MNFWQRLSRFGIGIVIGIALSLYFFGSRGCGSWLPSAQVRTNIVEGGVQLSQEVREAHPALTVTDVLSFVGSADVNFGDSGPRDTPQWYFLEQEDAAPGNLTALEVVLLDTASVVRRVAFQD